MIQMFTPHEILHTFEVLIKNQMTFPEDHEVLLNKYRLIILDALSKEYDKAKVEGFQAWEETQSKKIKDLEKQNEEVVKDLPKPKK
jgi:KaiC/GvpD/RAD55 family RecA-like ATPase